MKSAAAIIVGLLALGLLALSAAAWASELPNPDSRALSSATARIGIRDFAYHPRVLLIGRGTKVVFANHDSVLHNAKRDHSFSTALLRRGDAVAVRFNHRGVYGYYCSLHPFMHGRIVVR